MQGSGVHLLGATTSETFTEEDNYESPDVHTFAGDKIPSYETAADDAQGNFEASCTVSQGDLPSRL